MLRSVPVSLRSTPTPCLPRRIIPGAKDIFLAEVERGGAKIVNVDNKVTKGGRAFREETDNVYRSYLCLLSNIPLSALPDGSF